MLNLADIRTTQVFTNEEYLKIVVPDEQKFLKRDDAVMLVGWEVPRWVDGKEV
jgi:hypothetical protein